MIRRNSLLLTVVAAMVATAVSADDLGIGDPAPKLQVKEFVKGAPIKDFEKGKAYVVEFWATWCGPCKQTIPHLTELQKKYKDVRFVGVAVFEQDQELVKPFVKEMGEKMEYAVAIDDVAKGQEADSGPMAKNWMMAAGQEGIPTAFIINKESKIAWIGHPTEMEDPLKEIVAGTYDMKPALARQAKERELNAARKAREKKLTLAQQKGEVEFLKAIDEVIGEDSELEPVLSSPKLTVLAGKGPGHNNDKLLAYGQKLLDGIYQDSAEALNNLAWLIVDPDAGKRPEPLVQLALKASLRADKLEGGKNGAIADTLAKAYFDSGDVAKAIETQERAIKVLGAEADAEMKARLEIYKKAVKK